MRILITADGSSSSQRAIGEAMALLPLERAEIFVLSVTPLAPDRSTGSMPAECMTRLQDESRAAIAEARSRLAAAGFPSVGLERLGDPATEILAVARELEPSVIVLGNHGRGMMSRWMYGSVSTAMMKNWPGTILLTREPQAMSVAHSA
jgi:nucleotide-binding universal stress UspA family protein